jgi:hypothetical protein
MGALIQKICHLFESKERKKDKIKNVKRKHRDQREKEKNCI